MWKPYLKVIREKCSQALHVLDRFHIAAKMNDAVDDVRAEEARKMKAAGHEILKHTRWCLLKRQENLTDDQRFRLRDLLAYNLRTVRAYYIAQRSLPAVLGLQLASLGGQVPRRMVLADHAFSN